MASCHFETDLVDGWLCRCCGCGQMITLLRDPQSLTLYLGEASVQRRGFRCMNCNHVICFSCGHNGRRCTCKCNAWVALPYIDSMATVDLHA